MSSTRVGIYKLEDHTELASWYEYSDSLYPMAGDSDSDLILTLDSLYLHTLGELSDDR